MFKKNKNEHHNIILLNKKPLLLNKWITLNLKEYLIVICILKKKYITLFYIYINGVWKISRVLIYQYSSINSWGHGQLGSILGYEAYSSDFRYTAILQGDKYVSLGFLLPAISVINTSLNFEMTLLLKFNEFK